MLLYIIDMSVFSLTITSPLEASMTLQTVCNYEQVELSRFNAILHNLFDNDKRQIYNKYIIVIM